MVIVVNRVIRFLCVSMSLLAANVYAWPLTILTNKLTTSMSDLPRYEKLPLFNPHRKEFKCVYQDQHVPPADAQAEQWFQQALVLDDPDVYYKRRNYEKIYRLYEQAAERNHWKAMLNLASLILSPYPGVPERNPEVAIRWVEKAMLLGVPDAYDRMGVYHQRGLVKGGSATSAYAFFQRAADMGSPFAMTFLGDKLGGTYDAPDGEFWDNRPVAIEMLQCAIAQGYGNAAYWLGLYQKSGYSDEAKTQALRTFHDGVRLGCAKCANKLALEFRGFGLTSGENLIGYVDQVRARRYKEIGNALEHYQGRLKLPNLDKILPLPPAPLPKWDGNVKTLIDAAKAVTPPPKKYSADKLGGRAHIPEGQGVLPLEQSPYAVSGDKVVPESGYWLALYGLSTMRKDQLQFARNGDPEHYRAGERFDPPHVNWLEAEQVQWHYLGESRPVPPGRSVFLAQLRDAGFLRQLATQPEKLVCHGSEPCPKTGIWEARVGEEHSLGALYNQWDQQSFVISGQPFPKSRDRYLDIEPERVQWVFMGSANARTDDGFERIAL
ncbi:SEL1-like repeat protein [Burkholderia multivorans]|uniref:SEL1-like repeat protein n=1 Tax=Burkholderia multivorans TaxID=87883 RepID=UPI0021BFE5C1|nr:sel1 repeat family protein [Burkholderia multivorans]